MRAGRFYPPLFLKTEHQSAPAGRNTLFRSIYTDSYLNYLDNSIRSFATHVMNSILVTKPVGTFDRVIHMPSPVVFCHVPECSIDTTLEKVEFPTEFLPKN
jgi:hypothetical protein